MKERDKAVLEKIKVYAVQAIQFKRDMTFGSNEQPKYSISNLYVLPEKHLQGIGKMLFKQLFNDAKANNAKSFHVPSSLNAVGFYEKIGFVVDEMQPDKDDEITWMTMDFLE